MFFSEADRDELARMGWNLAQIGALAKHTQEIWDKSRNDYSHISNIRFARIGNASEEASYAYAISSRPKITAIVPNGFNRPLTYSNETPNAYDRTLSCNDNPSSKIMYGFDFLWMPRPEVKKESYAPKTFTPKPYVKKPYVPRSA